MNRKQKQKFVMNKAVSHYVGRLDEDVRAGIPKLDEVYENHKKNNKKIAGFTNMQMAKVTGKTITKEKLRMQMTDVALDVSANVIGYARNEGEIELYGAVNYKKRDLVLFTDSQCEAVCRVIYERAMGVVDLMGDYGLGCERLAEFKGLVDRFKGCIGSPQAVIEGIKAGTSGIKACLLEADVLLERMDGLIEMVRVRKPEIYWMYNELRKLRKPGYRKLSGQGWVKDSLGVALDGVVMHCEALGLKKQLSRHGGFRLFRIKDGEYDLVFEREGYEKVVVRVWIVAGRRVEVEVVMGEIILNDEL